MIVTDEDTHDFLASSVERPDGDGEPDGLLQSRLPSWLEASNADRDAWRWLARQTVELDPDATGQGPVSLLVGDLGRHPRMERLSAVTGPPYLDWYAAAPIRTNLGIAIGTFAVVAGRTRPVLSAREMELLVTMASHCMSQLETAREVGLRQRAVKMSEALNEFIVRGDAAEPMLEDVQSLNHPRATRAVEKTRSDEGGGAIKVHETEEDEHARGTSQRSASRPEDQQAPSGDEGKDSPGETLYRKTFRRAAEHLRMSLEIEGVLFADGLIGFHGDALPTAEPEQELQREMSQRKRHDDVTARPLRTKRAPHDAMSTDTTEALDAPGQTAETANRTYLSSAFEKIISTERPAEVIGMSVVDDRALPRREQLTRTTLGMYAFDSALLQLLMKRHPHGVIWYFDEEARPYRVESDRIVPDDDTTGDAKKLLATFPDVRQIIFSPLTDPVSQKRLAGCIGWTSQVLPVLTDGDDLQPFKAFLHTVEAEISRIEIGAAIQQRDSFVSSVSHELRSPLHGILGAVEFLGDTDLDSFQQVRCDYVVGDDGERFVG